MSTPSNTGPFAAPGGPVGPVPGASSATGPNPPTKIRKRTWITAGAMAFLLIVLVAGQLVRMPYVIYSPGPAQDTLGRTDNSPIIEISGTQTYPTSGALDFTTVSLYGGPDHPVSFWQWARAKFDSTSMIVPEEDVFGDKSGQQIEQESAAEMTGSQQSAEVVAVRAAGDKVGERLFIGSVQAKGPSADKLKVGDEVLRVQGKSATTLNSLHAAMDSVQPGEKVTVRVTRAGKQVDVPITTGRNGDRALLGVLLAPKYSFPYTIKVNAGDVGGPSAGLMFSLAIYDKLTPGALTGGKQIAGTGTIDTSGTVGPIGGIRQKLVGARDSGADYFLAPAQNCNEVKGHIPSGLKVVKVSTFDGAKTAVSTIASGGDVDALPHC
ncbi:PDZ domain-containing protein [Dermacoccaceae bacterium W4C1]